jgi:hypothetical protein
MNNKINELLGLPATATEADIIAAIKVLQAENTDLKTRVTAATTQKRETDEVELEVNRIMLTISGGMTREQVRESVIRRRNHSKSPAPFVATGTRTQ